MKSNHAKERTMQNNLINLLENEGIAHEVYPIEGQPERALVNYNNENDQDVVAQVDGPLFRIVELDGIVVAPRIF